MTTLKPCDGDNAIFDAQLAAVASWAALPLDPSPSIYLIDTEATSAPAAHPAQRRATCSQLIARVLGNPKVRPVRIRHAVSDHGTVLLGSALRAVAELEPMAQVLGFINGDILLDPASVEALLAAQRSFDEYFLVGRRASVDLRAETLRNDIMPAVVQARSRQDVVAAGGAKRNHASNDEEKDRQEGITAADPLHSADWFKHSVFTRATGDRIDAEDYFIFTRKFFDALPYPVPDFHIGRPAYDNWLVHTAIHTLQPVIDATGAILAYHQAHDYKHLKGSGQSNNNHHDGGGDGKGAAPSSSSSSWSYWGSQDQKANYDLAMAHGGWRHGLFDFAALHFVELATSSARHGGDADDAKVGGGNGAGHAGDRNPFQLATNAAVKANLDCSPNSMVRASDGERRCLAVTLKPGWKPLGNDGESTARDDVALASMPDYFRALSAHVIVPRRKHWRELAAASGNPYFSRRDT